MFLAKWASTLVQSKAETWAALGRKRYSSLSEPITALKSNVRPEAIKGKATIITDLETSNDNSSTH